MVMTFGGKYEHFAVLDAGWRAIAQLTAHLFECEIVTIILTGRGQEVYYRTNRGNRQNPFVYWSTVRAWSLLDTIA